jgi:pimeloyl-ACP methyl ester carboxylesterase
MLMAAQPRSPVSALVVNDVGPVLEPEAMARIAAYVGLDPRFDSFGELESHVRKVSAPFGPLTDAQWRRLSETTARRLSGGGYALRYDPAIAVPFREAVSERTDLWPVWDRITCPTLLLRGTASDLLSAATAAEMTRRGPKPRLVEFTGVGHAPMLMDSRQIDIVEGFLDANRAAPAPP